MKSLFLALALLSATTLLGQDSQSNPQPGTTPTDRPLSQQTVKGCLQGTDDHLPLTDSNETRINLRAIAQR